MKLASNLFAQGGCSLFRLFAKGVPRRNTYGFRFPLPRLTALHFTLRCQFAHTIYASFCRGLSIIFVLIFLVLILSSCKKAPATAEKVERPKKEVVAKVIEPKPVEEEKFIYASHDKHDPFVPLVDKKGRPIAVVEGGLQFKVSDLFLEGIIWDDVKPMAIINDEIVSAGDKISGVTVIKVEKDKVILSYKDESFELKMD